MWLNKDVPAAEVAYWQILHNMTPKTDSETANCEIPELIRKERWSMKNDRTALMIDIAGCCLWSQALHPHYLPHLLELILIYFTAANSEGQGVYIDLIFLATPIQPKFSMWYGIVVSLPWFSTCSRSQALHMSSSAADDQTYMNSSIILIWFDLFD